MRWPQVILLTLDGFQMISKEGQITMNLPKYPQIPEEYRDYYRIATPEDLEFDDEDFVYQEPILDGYDELFYGWAVAKEGALIYDDLLSDGLDYLIIGWSPSSGFKLYQVAGGRLYYADDEINQMIDADQEAWAEERWDDDENWDQ